MHCVIIF
jgi:pbp2_mrdA: penicillin-binding protein 2